jgi:hypothetical protein
MHVWRNRRSETRHWFHQRRDPSASRGRRLQIVSNRRDPSSDAAPLQAALFTHKRHQPFGEMAPSTSLQPLGETKFTQSSQSWPFFGDG